jgi:hypothetical protein
MPRSSPLETNWRRVRQIEGIAKAARHPGGGLGLAAAAVESGQCRRVDPNYNLWAVDRCETDDCIPVIEPDLTARHLPQSERVDTRFHAHGDGLRESTNMCERGPGQQEEIQKCSSVGRSMPERRATETANSRTPVLWIGQQKPFAKTGRGGDG